MDQVSSKSFSTSIRQLLYFVRRLTSPTFINADLYSPHVVELIREKIKKVNQLQIQVELALESLNTPEIHKESNREICQLSHKKRRILSCGRFLMHNNLRMNTGIFDNKYTQVYDLYMSLTYPICQMEDMKYLHHDWNKDINRLNPLRKIQCYYQCKKLIKYTEHQPEQKSVEWLTKRESYITASVVAVALNKNKYKSYIESLFESSGIFPAFVGNEATLFGEKYEPVATKIYELDHNIICDEYIKESRVYESAFIPSSDPRYFYIGGSPDGIVLEKTIRNGHITRDGYLIEIKCPFRRWPKGNVPEHYWMQMQIQLEVCDLERGYFVDFKIREYDDFVDILTYRYEYCNKGAVININTPIGFSKKGEPIANVTNYYSPIFTYQDSETDVLNWVKQTIKEKNIDNYSVSYYIVAKKYYTEVIRDRAWLNSNSAQIYKYWGDKQYYKHNFQELFDILDQDIPLKYLDENGNVYGTTTR